jgi:pimeloyl-ACP methyl ester carboxylesterase
LTYAGFTFIVDHQTGDSGPQRAGRMHYLRTGKGRPLLLIHSLGGSSRSWQSILPELAREREVLAIDLPGFGKTPPLAGEVSLRTLADAVTAFLDEQGLTGIDAVGSALGASLVLELARRRRVLGHVVSLAPLGFSRGAEVHYLYASLRASLALVRTLAPVLPLLVRRTLTRSLLGVQLSASPGRLPPPLVLDALHDALAAQSFETLLKSVAYGECQAGAVLGAIEGRVVIGWGRCDRVCLPRQAKRALASFPDAQLHWFPDCGHFPHWDAPRETTRLILEVTEA